MRISFVALSAVLATPAVLAAQPPPVAPPTNLQVLPKDTRPEDVVAVMQQIAQALGVQCTYCHVQPPPQMLTPEEVAAGVGRGRGQGPPPMNFASDEKPTKNAARAMLTMVTEINTRLAGRLGKSASELVRVQCVTCHRGVTNPQQLADVLWDTMLGKGDGAAVALYRDSRQRYYGAQAYDFRETLLSGLAQRALAANKPDDALAWAQLNLEFYPQSVASYMVLAEVHSRKKDVAAAAKDLEKVLELDPANSAAKRQLRGTKP